MNNDYISFDFKSLFSLDSTTLSCCLRRQPDAPCSLVLRTEGKCSYFSVDYRRALPEMVFEFLNFVLRHFIPQKLKYEVKCREVKSPVPPYYIVQ